MSKRVLILGYVWPEPRSSAAGSRMLQLLKLFLRQGWQITFASAAQLSEHRFDLTTLGVKEKVVALNCSSFNDFLVELKPELVLFDRFFTEEQFGWRVAQTCPDAIRVLDTEDLHSLRAVREKIVKAAQKQTISESEKYALELLADNDEQACALMRDEEMALREIAAIFRSDLSLIISTAEHKLLQNQFSVPENILLYCPFLADALMPTLIPWAQREHFISIGNFRHAPNWDAVLSLKHSIWPRIRARLPRAQLHIYGAYLPPKASALHNAAQGFYIRGWAEDARVVMTLARVCLAPLRFGAGLKGKLLEAMECGTPSVTTSIGAEGMHGALPWGGAVAHASVDFAAAAVTLYEDEDLWHKAQLNAATVRQEMFLSQAHAQTLLAKLHELFNELAQHRSNNFMGNMLRYHVHRSTQYMSQWIEAKNRKPDSTDT